MNIIPRSMHFVSFPLMGSWKLPHQGGSTRVSLLLLIDTSQWPGDGTQGIFSAERMAQAVLGLEKDALKLAR